MKYTIENGTLSLGGRVILDHIDFSVKGKEKVAVVGRNGAGKTTLLRLLAGELSLDRDDRRFCPGVRKEGNRKEGDITVGFLHQKSFAESEQTVEEILLSQFAGSEIRSAGDDGFFDAELFSRERYEFEVEYNRILTGFGFTGADKQKKVSDFSGGEQTKLAFGMLLLSKPDVLLLDEPTNHLDIASVEWLENYLRTYERAVVMVSHDRFFLDRTAEVVYELADGKLTRYAGNYSEFKAQKEKMRRTQLKNYHAQQKEIERLNALIEKFKHKPKKASMARSKKKVLERMNRVNAPDREASFIFKEKIDPNVRGSKIVLETKELKIGYDRPLREITWRLRRGQKTAILGPNGSGKTTFLKTITGVLPAIDGRCSLGNHVVPGYFDQHSAEICSEKRVWEHFGYCFPKLTDKEKRQILGHYLFPSEKAGVPVDSLSGGEKSRLLLAELLESRPNFLILDEPTNHMDLPAKETLESAFEAYTGTMLFVSHDRYFISQVADSLLIFEGEEVKYYPFGYEHYLRMIEKKQDGAISIADAVAAENTALVEDYNKVPVKERHQAARFNTEQSYTDWQLTLAGEQLAKCRRNIEEQENAYEKEMENMYEEQLKNLDEKQLEIMYEEQPENAYKEKMAVLMNEYHEACLLWYEKWQEYEEAFDSYRDDI